MSMATVIVGSLVGALMIFQGGLSRISAFGSI
jgi:hypothetical protein